MIEIIAAKVLESATSGAVAILTEAIRRENEDLVQKKKDKRIEASFSAPVQVVKSALLKHLDEISNWSRMVSISDARTSKLLHKIYVDLDTYLMPLNTHFDKSEREEVQRLLPALINSNRHCAILGQPGAGKTTSLQKICSDYFNSGKVLLNYSFPILVRLRDLSNSTSSQPIVEKIQEILGVNVVFGDEHQVSAHADFYKLSISETVIKYVDGLGAVLLLDGYDEISSFESKAAALNDIDKLARKLKKTKLLVTSRSREFRYALSSIQQYELAPLRDFQIEEFAHKWLDDKRSAKDFLKKVDASPFSDNAVRPLTLAHLCAIYERIKRLPDKPKSVYKKIINMLLEEWDSQRSVARASRYAEFDSDRKHDFLAHLSFMLTIRGYTIFDKKTLKSVYSKIYKEYGLSANQATKVVEEIESHSGLIVEGGYDSFEFAHKSLQEFLAADYLVRLPSLFAIEEHAYKLPNEFAIATALSSNPTEYMCDVVQQLIGSVHIDSSWYSIYLSRLALEKPDFHPTDPFRNSVSALTLLTYSRQVEAYLDMLRPIIPKNAYRFLGKYYSCNKIVQDGVYTLQRNGVHSEIKIPPVLWIPIEFL